MVDFKENYHFPRFQGGLTFSRGGGSPTLARRGSNQFLISYIYSSGSVDHDF